MMKTMIRPLGMVLLLAGWAQAQSLQSVVFSENFDSLTLQDSVNERFGTVFVTRPASDTDSSPVPNAFSPTGPAGWSVNRTTFGMFDGVPSDTYNPSPTIGNAGVPGTGVAEFGVDEWDGWNFANKDFWVKAAGEQDRELFTNAGGTVAVADPDEYFDLGDGPSDDPVNGGYYNSSMSTPSLPVTAGTFYTLSFDSSWRPEAFDDDYPRDNLGAINNQAVEVLARYDNGEAVVVNGWNSDDTSATFKDDAPNERLDNVLFVPAGASNVTFEFNIANAGNDWWWAVDNLDLSEGLVPGANTVWSEDFEGVALGDSVNEREAFAKTTAAESTPDTVPRPNSFTNVAPTNWTIDNSGLPGGGATRDDNGVYEFEGWNFMTLDFWTFADTQGRENFLKCEGNCVVADSDEFDDLGAGNDDGPLDTLLTTPSVDITAVPEGELGLLFDSAWRKEGSQTALISAEFFDDMGNSLGTVEALRWESDSASMFFHDDNTNETVLLGIDNPAGAASVQLTFSYLNGSNNYFWAIDNVQIGVVPEPTSLGLTLLALVGFAVHRRRR